MRECWVWDTSKRGGGNDDRIERHEMFPPFGNFPPESLSVHIETAHRVSTGGSFPLLTSLEVADVDLKVGIFCLQFDNSGLKPVHRGLQTNQFLRVEYD